MEGVEEEVEEVERGAPWLWFSPPPGLGVFWMALKDSSGLYFVDLIVVKHKYEIQCTKNSCVLLNCRYRSKDS